ncbi:helix-turn-helix transcriptional regulator [Shewanella zhangzhouensis]|uniref:helix-turn-helix transcriptional regulator n=1 Tax=Shewanella zhangzhouensis TaxID=2864213 RepID=UPI001C65C890|nr:DNA-binding response regulator [Shewanella zhangzhouensis]QYK04161.1 DNA-binding response regulator [Shewanella zhangzhouensis]
MNRDTITLVVLLLVIIASGSDIYMDLSQGASMMHLIEEAIVLGLATLLLSWFSLSYKRQKRQIQELSQELLEARNQAQPTDAALLEARHRLADVMAIQFETWELSPSEKEVGMLLLKGLSLKEIALLRGTAEKTIRQQASAIYKKAGVVGRHGFAAWFIEDFL